MVIDLAPRGPASKAGIKEGTSRAQIGNTVMIVGGDIIVQVNGESVSDAHSVIRAIRKSRPGDRVEMEVVHWEGGRSKVTIVLGEQPRSGRNR